MTCFSLAPSGIKDCPWKLQVQAKTRFGALVIADEVLRPEHYDLEVVSVTDVSDSRDCQEQDT